MPWSPVPDWLVFIGEILFAIGLVFVVTFKMFGFMFDRVSDLAWIRWGRARSERKFEVIAERARASRQEHFAALMSAVGVTDTDPQEPKYRWLRGFYDKRTMEWTRTSGEYDRLPDGFGTGLVDEFEAEWGNLPSILKQRRQPQPPSGDTTDAFGP
jgi:hypothetical protein